MIDIILSRQWIGFSPEIETWVSGHGEEANIRVASGLASHLRLKRPEDEHDSCCHECVASGLASHLRLKQQEAMKKGNSPVTSPVDWLLT